MKRLVLPFVGALAVSMPASAQSLSLGSFVTPEQSLTYVDNTYITGIGGNHLVLCRSVETQTVMGLGVWVKPMGYVLSESGCDGQTARENAGLVNVAFAAGALSGTPREPVLSMRERVEGHAGLGLVGLLALGLFGWRLSRSGPKTDAAAGTNTSQLAERLEVLNLTDGPTFRRIDAMLHAANVSGPANSEQIAFIRDKAAEICAADYTIDHIEWAILHTDTLETAEDFACFGVGAAPHEAHAILEDAVAVMGVGSEMTVRERHFVTNLKAGLGIGSEVRPEDGLSTSQAGLAIPAQ